MRFEDFDIARVRLPDRSWLERADGSAGAELREVLDVPIRFLDLYVLFELLTISGSGRPVLRTCLLQTMLQEQVVVEIDGVPQFLGVPEAFVLEAGEVAVEGEAGPGEEQAAFDGLIDRRNGMCGGCRVIIGDTSRFACINGPKTSA